jgi:adenylate cyclase
MIRLLFFITPGEDQMTGAKLLYVLDGKLLEQPLKGGDVTIGRSPQMGVSIPESVPGISRHHATVQKRGLSWWLVDNNSRNGSFINQTRVIEAELHHSDVIHLGPFEIQFLNPEPAKATWSASMMGSLAEPNIEFADRDPSLVSRTIDLASFRAGRSIDRAAPLPLFATSKPAPLLAGGESSTGNALANQAWAIELFSKVGQALQVSTDLDEMFETLLTLLFSQVPAERAFVGLIDPNTGEVLPRMTRLAEGLFGQSFQLSRTILRIAIDSRQALLVEDTMEDSRFQEALSIRQTSICSAICVPLYRDGHVSGVLYIDTREKEAPLTPHHLEIATALALFTAVAVEQFRLREKALAEERLRQSLARYSSPAVVDRILQAGDAGQMIADKEVVTVLFSDLKGFTTMSEKLTPASVVEVLNAIFTRLTDAVFRQQGTLDKFMGDGMLAFFGAPLRLADHALRAVRAAREMLTAVDEFNRAHPDSEPIGIRIGINTGDVIVGDIGSLTRKDYTVIGDTVNVASRLESSVAGTNQIAIGPRTYEAVRNDFTCEPLEPIRLKGKTELVQPYRVISENRK